MVQFAQDWVAAADKAPACATPELSIRVEPGKLREAIERDYANAFGRSPQPVQLDWLERVVRQIFGAKGAETGRIDRTINQLVDGMNLPVPVTGEKHVRAVRQRYRNQIIRTLGYLQRMGWVSSFGALMRDDGRGRCILIDFPAGVAQSVRAAES